MALRLLNDDEQVTVLDSALIEGGDQDTSYTIRKLTPEKQREIVKRNTRPGNYRRTGDTINWNAVQDDQLDYVLLAWSGVKDGERDAECSRANKLMLDGVRKLALIDRAGMAEVIAAEEARDASFRGTA